MKHTPGPWEHDKYHEIVVGKNGQFVCLTQKQGGTKHENTIGNNKLIASAPDLLATCQNALLVLENMTSEDFSLGKDQALRTELEQAIKKATE